MLVYGPALLGMPDIELLGMLMIMCEVVGGQQIHWKFNSRAMKLSSTLSCKANKHLEIRSDNADVVDPNPSMLDYFRSSVDRAADKKASWLLMQRNHTEFSDVSFFRNLGV